MPLTIIPPSLPKPEEPRLPFPPLHEVEADPERIFLDLDHEDPQRLIMWLAICVSIIVHFVLFLSVPSLVRLWPKPIRMAIMSSEDLLKDNNVTFLQLPPDKQVVPRTPKSDIISDKDRIASSRHPDMTLNKKFLKELADARKAGAPGTSGPQSPAAAPSPAAPTTRTNAGVPAPSASGNNGVSQSSGPTLSNLQSPAMGGGRKNPANVFGTAVSPGTAIEQATRAAAASRGGGIGAGGQYGSLDYGRSPARVQSDFEILTDTMGVDFSSYLARAKQEIYDHWIVLIPEVARAPLMKQGKVTVDFVILKDGSVAGMKLRAPSGDVSLDRAAWGGISGSNPFPPLPSQFPGQYLGIRCTFFYNPSRADLQ